MVPPLQQVTPPVVSKERPVDLQVSAPTNIYSTPNIPVISQQMLPRQEPILARISARGQAANNMLTSSINKYALFIL
jgi:hypothetical protein